MLQLDHHGLVRWAPPPPPTGPRKVADVLDPVVAADPGRLALVDDEGELTYAEVDAQANRVAHVLWEEGVRPGDRVAMCLPNGSAIVVAFLAVMRLGGIWVGVNRALATREALTGDGWLRTGDQGRLLPDGSLQVVGRRNDVILRGGANVCPAEVEQALCAHPAVAETAVVGRPDERLGEVPFAFVRLREGAELTAEDLIAHCAGRLARYKVPVGIRFVADLPRNAMGKVVKQRLAGD